MSEQNKTDILLKALEAYKSIHIIREQTSY